MKNKNFSDHSVIWLSALDSSTFLCLNSLMYPIGFGCAGKLGANANEREKNKRREIAQESGRGRVDEERVAKKNCTHALITF